MVRERKEKELMENRSDWEVYWDYLKKFKDVEEVEFSYFDGWKWHQHWEGKNSPPQMVKLKLKARKQLRREGFAVPLKTRRNR